MRSSTMHSVLPGISLIGQQQKRVQCTQNLISILKIRLNC